MDILEQIDKFINEEKEFFIKAVEIKGHKVKLVRLGKWASGKLTSQVRVYLDDKKFGDFKNKKLAMSQVKKEIK